MTPQPVGPIDAALAERFDHDVRQGGFAQLLYNLQGDSLADVEDMLIHAGASIAHDHYVRAIRICLKDAPTYRRFLQSNYIDANAVKDALHLLSIEYFATRTPFAV